MIHVSNTSMNHCSLGHRNSKQMRHRIKTSNHKDHEVQESKTSYNLRALRVLRGEIFFWLPCKLLLTGNDGFRLRREDRTQ